jgi:hypothetical protein
VGSVLQRLEWNRRLLGSQTEVAHEGWKRNWSPLTRRARPHQPVLKQDGISPAWQVSGCRAWRASVLHVGVMQVTPLPHGRAGCAVGVLGTCLCVAGLQGPSVVSEPPGLSARRDVYGSNVCFLDRKDSATRRPTLHRVEASPSRARFELPPSYQGRLPIFATIASSLSYLPISLHPSPPSRPPGHRQSNQRVHQYQAGVEEHCPAALSTPNTSAVSHRRSGHQQPQINR